MNTNFLTLNSFVVYFLPSETKISIFLACRKHTTRKIIILIGYIFLHLTASLSQRSYTILFTGQTLRDNFIIKQIGDEQFYRQLKSANFYTRTVLSRNEVLISLFVLL